MYSIVGGVPFHSFDGQLLFTAIKVYANFEKFEEIKEYTDKYWEMCGGLMTVLYNGQEMPYDSELNYTNPENPVN